MQMTGFAYGTRQTMTLNCLGNGALQSRISQDGRAYLGTAQHNYSHWTRVALPEGRPDMAQLEGTPGVLPFEVYSQAPLRLISWCSFELPKTAKKLLRELAEMCELPETTTQALVTHIAAHNSEVKNGARGNPILSHVGNCDHLVKDQIAQLYHHGSTLPWHLAIAHGCLHARLLSAHAQPQ